MAAEKLYWSYEQVHNASSAFISYVRLCACATTPGHVEAIVLKKLSCAVLYYSSSCTRCFNQIQSLIRHAIVEEDILKDYKPTLIVTIAAGGEDCAVTCF